MSRAHDRRWWAFSRSLIRDRGGSARGDRDEYINISRERRRMCNATRARTCERDRKIRGGMTVGAVDEKKKEKELL